VLVCVCVCVCVCLSVRVCVRVRVCAPGVYTSPSSDPSSPPSLSLPRHATQVMAVDKLLDCTPEEVTDIWLQFHSDDTKNMVSGAQWFR
jgi:hypothetical protein